MGAQLVEQLDAIHDGIVHQGGGNAHGLAGAGGQRGPGPGQATGARGGHGQAHGHVGGGKIEGGALGFAVFTGTGQEFHFLHQGEETAAQARVAADAGNGGFPGLADALFFRGLQETLGIVHALDEIVAAHEHAQDIAVDVTDGLAQAAARTLGLAVGSGLETSFGAAAAFVRPLGRSEFVVLVHAGCSSRPPDGASLYEFVGDAVSRNVLTGKPPEETFPAPCERECKLRRALEGASKSVPDALRRIFDKKNQLFPIDIINHLILLANCFNFCFFFPSGSGRQRNVIKKPPVRHGKYRHVNYLKLNDFTKAFHEQAQGDVQDNRLINMPFPGQHRSWTWKPFKTRSIFTRHKNYARGNVQGL